ncbi:hypothetical protein B0H10DRAFT_2243417 [Mycena sp. CBHHK59/15]|nr:hypothetical protein B0H10DRAFT_2243417 [Mycena sp. CBHHK59/15]
MLAGKSSAAGLSLSDSHPLSEELTSLRAAVTRFQAGFNEAHSSSIKLQRHALDTSSSSERIAQLEAENALLNSELAVLRDNPTPSTPSSVSAPETVAELTLSLRRLSSKLSLTETSLQEHTIALTQATSLATEKTHAAGEAYALAARARGREEECLIRERALQRAVAHAQEEAKLSDHVVKEYADLVRALEGRSPPPSAKGWAGENGNESSATLVDALAASKTDLQALSAASAQSAVAQDARIAELESALVTSDAQLAASHKLTAELGDELARAKFVAEKARIDDRSAAGMVERYMKFTQSTTIALHATLAGLRTRHDATLSTLHAQIAALTERLHGAHAEGERLRGALDELGGAMLRETIGRRREVALRVRMVGREERVAEALRRGVRRAADAGEEVGERDGVLVREVHAVLALLDGEDARGSEGRMVLLESAVEMLVKEMEDGVAQRVAAERDAPSATQPLEPEPAPMLLAPVAETPQPPVHVSIPPTEVILHQPSPRAPPNDSLLMEDFNFKAEAEVEDADRRIDAEDAHEEVDRLIDVGDADSAFPGPSSAPSLSPSPIVPPGPQSQAAADGVDAVFLAAASDATPPLHDDVELGAATEGTQDVDAARVASPEASDALAEAPPVPMEAPAPVDPPRAEPLTHPLLADLETASKRYDALQRAFRDCHLALQELRAALAPPSAQLGAQQDVLRSAVERLHDYTEDARVELEIRVADERVLARGWETLVLLPHTPDSNNDDALDTEDGMGSAEIARQIAQFVRGDDPAVRRAEEGFRHKLEDVEHDIAVVKRAVYAPPSTPSPAPAASPDTSGDAGGWAAWIRGSRAGTPAPSSPSYADAPTFGSVITSPRLRHSASAALLGGSPRRERERNPFEGLGLRVAMPSYVAPPLGGEGEGRWVG